MKVSAVSQYQVCLWIRWNETKDNRERESFELHDTYNYYSATLNFK